MDERGGRTSPLVLESRQTRPALARVGKARPMLKVVGSEDAEKQPAAAGSLLDELIRDGARQMLAAALQG